MPVHTIIKLFDKFGQILDRLFSGLGREKAMYEGIKKEDALSMILEARKNKLQEKNRKEQLKDE
jgi:hypothetical protein